MKIQRYSSGAYGGMAPNPAGNYVWIGDVAELLTEHLGADKAQAIIHDRFDHPETSDDREDANT